MRCVSRVSGLAATVVLAFAGHAGAQQARLASFEMTWPIQQRQAIGARAQAAAEVITGQQLRRRAVVAPTTSAAPQSTRLRISMPDAPALEIAYLPEYAELRIVNTELAASAPAADMAQNEAVNVARRTVEELARRNLVDPRHYDWEKADIASTWVGGGSVDGRTAERKRVEYRITLRRAINGIELANAGIRIAIHTSGHVSGLRLGGVTVASRISDGVETPLGNGRWLNGQVSVDDLQARFRRDVVPEKAKAAIAWSRVMYVMPENKRRAVVEPMYVVSYSLEFPTDAGQTAVSRRRTIGLSVTDPTAPPVDLTPPVRTPRADPTRKYSAGAR